MKELFGVSTATIAVVMAALFTVTMLGVTALFVSNRMMFRVGLRNIPRRGAQTALVIVGLTLSTLIVTAAFTTGDTIDYSISKQTYDLYGRSDLNLTFGGTTEIDAFSAPAVQVYVGDGVVQVLEARFAGDPDIAGFLPFLVEQAPVLNERTRLAEPAVVLNGIDPQRLGAVGGLRLVGGGTADLSALTDEQAFVSQRAADKLDARQGDRLTLVINGAQYRVQVAGIVENELASGVRGFGDSDIPGSIAMTLSAVQRITGHVGDVNFVTIASGDSVRTNFAGSDAAGRRIRTYLASPDGQNALRPFIGNLDAGVQFSKHEAVDDAVLTANLFTTIFLVIGLFSIAGGVLLIFLIFVMLAAERKPEMGIARAVGAQRGHLVQAFLAEGVAYALLASAVGAALGVGAAVVLVVGLMRWTGGDAFSFVTAKITPTAIVIGYTLGVLITFVTVVVSALRVSHLNIVTAIRGLADEQEREERLKTAWKSVAIGILLSLIVPPVGLWYLLRRGFGLPRAWVWGLLGIVAGALCMLVSQSNAKLFFFALGISLLPLSAAALASYYGVPARLTWSIVGAVLAAYWLLPFDLHDRLFGKLDGGNEMLVLFGIMIVTAFTLLIVFNARLLATLFERPADVRQRYRVAVGLGVLTVAAVMAGTLLGERGDGLGKITYLVAGLLGVGAALAGAAARFPRLAPALKMAVAYPLANRFRTGMAIAMFSLTIFSLTLFSILNANFGRVFNGADADAGLDIVVTTDSTNPVPDLRAALTTANAPVLRDIEAVGRVSLYANNQAVRQPSVGDTWETYPVLAADDHFFDTLQPALDARAIGYDSDAQVLEAVRTQPDLALIDPRAIDAASESPYTWRVQDAAVGDERFEPFQIEVRDLLSEKTATLTVIGVLSAQFDPAIAAGLYTNEATYATVFGVPVYERAYLTLVGGADAEAAAKGIESTLLTQGVQAQSIEAMLDESNAQNRVFTRIFQGFMGLGLLVGIAALGVIAFRSVVERRQQIGMLRAIGYQRGTVALTFLLEAGFVALMGILSGVVGATILARNILASDAITGGLPMTFFIPWSEVIAFVVIAFVFSLLMTWWPSRGAARIEIAEALRYE